MQLKVIYNDEEKQIILENMEDFEPRHIFECGQCFRWHIEEDGSYTIVAYNRILNVKRDGDKILLNNTNREDFEQIWKDYFDLENDYEIIKETLKREDPIMEEAIQFGYGIRILKQEPWETLISFIISSNNNIPRIKRAIEELSKGFGEYIGNYKGREYYAFPKPEVLASCSIEEIQGCNTGYRASYIINTAKLVIEREYDLDSLKKLTINACEEKLMEFSGVGPKVANCILFFAMEKREAFPIDVWVKRVMEYFYFHESTSVKEIAKFAEKRFGHYGGYAQQYLFYYARELNIGKK